MFQFDHDGVKPLGDGPSLNQSTVGEVKEAYLGPWKLLTRVDEVLRQNILTMHVVRACHLAKDDNQLQSLSQKISNGKPMSTFRK